MLGRCKPVLYSGSLLAQTTLASLLIISTRAVADCLPFAEANKHLGTSRCVTGKVVKITHSEQGTTFLNFCEDYRVCPFQIVVFRGDLPHVGDVRHLVGKNIEIHGKIEDYDGHTEIVLKRLRQLQGDAGKIPPLPKGFDVEKKGRYNAGRLSHPKPSHPKSSKRQSKPIQMEDPENEE